MTDFWRAHFDEIYNRPEMGEPAILTLTNGDEVDVIVIDRRTGGEVLTDPGVMTLVPQAVIRAYDLEDVDRAILDGAALMFEDESAWTVVSHQLRGAPSGPGNGEILLMLEEA